VVFKYVFMCMFEFCNMFLCMCWFFNVWLCVFLGVVMCGFCVLWVNFKLYIILLICVTLLIVFLCCFLCTYIISYLPFHNKDYCQNVENQVP
jgi:hypothetical protein